MKRTMQNFRGFLLLIVALGFAGFGTAQDDAGVKGPQIVEAYFGSGPVLQTRQSRSLPDWRAMLPGSELLQREFPEEWSYGSYYSSFGGYVDPGPYGDYATTGTGMMYLGLALALGPDRTEAARSERRLRLGVCYSGSETDFSAWGRSLSGRYDTLVSQGNGELYFVDTTYTEQLTARLEWSRIGVDVAYVVRRNTNGRWTWQLGAGVQAGSRFDQRAAVAFRIERTEHTGFSTIDRSSDPVSSGTYRLSPSFWGGIYGLAGVEFCLGKPGRFMHSFNVFYEMRPTMLVQGSGEMRTNANGAFQHLVGLRFDLR